MEQKLKTKLTILALAAMLGALLPHSVAAASEYDGFIYGTVTTKSGNVYTGLLRWGTEEMFWDDLFHSAKDELPYGEYAERAEKMREKDDNWWQVFGRKLNVEFGDQMVSHVFISRFGDISSIRAVGKDDAVVTMKSGSVYNVSGYANDVGATIWIKDSAAGEIEVPWKKIETITFKEAPADVDFDATRIHGSVATDDGVFTGFVQWDSQEALSSDELDGDSEDGRMSIAMGKIASIERRSRRSSRVVLTDGREFVLDGTNDVNSSIRGIMVEDRRFGRVKIPWSAFDRVDFSSPKGSGRGYESYTKGGPIHGTVTTKDGETLSGNLVYDLDEAETWEMLNGSSFDIEYDIPFSMIASISPVGDSSADVTLKNGTELRLEDGHDVSADNDGILVLGQGQPKHILWSQVKSIDFE